MAWLFDGATSDLKCSAAPFAGYTMGPVTAAVLFKQNVATVNRVFHGITIDAGTLYGALVGSAGNRPQLFINIAAQGASGAIASTTVWWLLVGTYPGGGGAVKLHYYNGTSWTHAAAGGTLTDTAVPAGAYIRLGGSGGATPGSRLTGSIVCAGLRKADTSDAGVEALNMTTFQSWLNFGFNWLVGLKDLAPVIDQGSAGSGNELSRAGITLAADPPGWTWPVAAAVGRAQAVLL